MLLSHEAASPAHCRLLPRRPPRYATATALGEPQARRGPGLPLSRPPGKPPPGGPAGSPAPTRTPWGLTPRPQALNEPRVAPPLPRRGIYLSTTTMGLSLPVTTISPFQIMRADETIIPKFSTW